MGRMRSGRGDEGKRLTEGKCNHFPTYSFPSDKQPIIACNSAICTVTIPGEKERERDKGTTEEMITYTSICFQE